MHIRQKETNNIINITRLMRDICDIYNIFFVIFLLLIFINMYSITQCICTVYIYIYMIFINIYIFFHVILHYITLSGTCTCTCSTDRELLRTIRKHRLQRWFYSSFHSLRVFMLDKDQNSLIRKAIKKQLYSSFLITLESGKQIKQL